MNYFIVDAFTSKPFGGNPAGVVLLGMDGAFPPDELMLKVAAELRYSETAFVQQNGPAEFTVRYFTPRSEVDLCGHATIATFNVLCREGIVPEGTCCINHTLAGNLEVKAGIQVMMQMAQPQWIDKPIDAATLHTIMAGDQAPRWPTMPIEIISTGLPDIIMPVADVDALNALKPDMDALAQLSRQLDVVGVHACALADDGYTAHTRNFAPLYGVPEESATGTANAALTHYLQRQGIVGDRADCSILQGEAMGRPSIVMTRIMPDCTIHVGGTSCIIATGTLHVSTCCK